MAKECPKCRLYNLSEASRCDCGYDFASGQMRTSYLIADRAQKQGAEKVMVQAGRGDIRTGIGLMIAAVAFGFVVWVVSRAGGGRGTVGVPMVPLFYGLYRYGRGITQRNQAKQTLGDLNRRE